MPLPFKVLTVVPYDLPLINVDLLKLVRGGQVFADVGLGAVEGLLHDVVPVSVDVAVPVTGAALSDS